MTVLVTGAAGFIGFHCTRALLARGDEVIGIDNMNDYYDVSLKRARLAQLEPASGFAFRRLDVSDRGSIDTLLKERSDITRVLHLAAQAGVRYSLENPYTYIEANVLGQVVLLEAARTLPRLENFVYASSSSVYGGNTKIPFAIEDPVDHPVSVYAASKRSAELLTEVYAHLYRMPCTGLRFFTVYGPWGRPDMAAYLFADAITAGRPIRVFNFGRMRRDFTYIDDIVAGVLAALDRPVERHDGGAPHRLYNLGNHHPVELKSFIEIIETALGLKADMRLEPIQPGDVPETFADIEDSRRDLGYEPITPVEVGIPRFVAWYRDYHSS